MSTKYEIVTWRGYRFDRYTIAAVEAAEKRLGYKLTVFQGSYNGGSGRVSASAGTHDGGGAIDVAATSDPAAIVHALRAIGFAAWHRLPLPGVWGEHIHAVLIGNTNLSPSAAQQVVYYRDGLDGLADHRRDSTWRPNPIPTFIYPEDADMALLADLETVRKRHNVTRVYAARLLLRAALTVAGPLRRARLSAVLAAMKGMP